MAENLARSEGSQRALSLKDGVRRHRRKAPAGESAKHVTHSRPRSFPSELFLDQRKDSKPTDFLRHQPNQAVLVISQVVFVGTLPDTADAATWDS